MAFLKVENLAFQYALSNSPALRGVNLELNEGDFAIICGPSGCGKSTFLRHLKKELRPHGAASGRILFRNSPLDSLTARESACEIGLVLQNPDSQIVTGEVLSELAFGLENLGLDPKVIRRKVSEMVTFFGIGSWLKKNTDELSGGQKQILNLASVLAMQPRLLLLDEPTSQLDPVAAKEFAEMLVRLNRELGITVVMTEHRLEDVLAPATVAAVMENGRIKYSAPPRELGDKIMETGDMKYLGYLPAAARIYYSLENHIGADCPLTVREGRDYLQKRLKARSAGITPSPAAAAPSGKPLLECQGVYTGYQKGCDILKDFSAQFYNGETVCVLGENGSGKTTLLHLLAGVLPARRGWVKLEGKNLFGLPDSQRYRGNLALLPQDPKAIFLFETVRAELAETARKNDTEEQIGPLTAKLGISGLLDRHPYDLSGGEQQKAALAKLLLTQPRILLLDEPTKGLDAVSRREFSEILGRLRLEGRCIILITHDMDFAAENADRCILLFDGSAACTEIPDRFFGGNFFYTTAANRISRGTAGEAITCGDVIKLCQNA